MSVLVLRPERAARRTVEALEALGRRAILAPVLTIEDLPSSIPDIAYDAVLATSANGLRKLRARPEIGTLAALPLIAVGDRTAAAGAEAGFAVIHIADGDGRALVAETRRLFPEPARFLHAAGADRAFDVAGALDGFGHAVTVVELYQATAATTLPATAEAALAAGEIEIVLHHSRRIAETFLRLADAAGHGALVRGLGHAALAPRVASALSDAGCAHVEIAERPDEPALFEAMRRLSDASPYGGLRSK